VHVAESIGEAQQFRLQWAEWMPGIELLIIESPYRSLIGPPLAYLDGLKAAYPRDTLTVVLPEYIPSRWWEQLLHNTRLLPQACADVPSRCRNRQRALSHRRDVRPVQRAISAAATR